MQLKSDSASMRGKSPTALRTISEAADLLDVPQHVLRFWETKFTQIKPLKRNGGRRYYRPEDIETLLQIKHLLYKQGYTIKGAKKVFDKKSVEEIRQEFSSVALGEPVGQDNDNEKPAAKADTVESPKEMTSVADELRSLSAQLRKKAGK